MEGRRPLFVGGTGRSGTSITACVLAASPSVASAPQELRFVADPGGILDLAAALDQSWTPHRAESALDDFERLWSRLASPRRSFDIVRRVVPGGWSLPAYGRWDLRAAFGPDMEAAWQTFLREIGEQSAPGHWIGSKTALRPRLRFVPFDPDCALAAVRRLVDRLWDARHRGTAFWMDDTPYSILRAREILCIWPESHFVHVLRDPLDVWDSLAKKSWGPTRRSVGASQIASFHEAAAVARARVPKGAWHVIRLEDLIADPAARIRDLASAIGIKPVPADAVDKVSSEKGHVGRGASTDGGAELEALRRRLGYAR